MTAFHPLKGFLVTVCPHHSPPSPHPALNPAPAHRPPRPPSHDVPTPLQKSYTHPTTTFIVFLGSKCNTALNYNRVGAYWMNTNPMLQYMCNSLHLSPVVSGALFFIFLFLQ